MRFVRLHLKSASRLALFALALQLLLTFGHVHADGFVPPGEIAAAARVTPATPDTPAPAPPDSDRLAHDFCVLCAVMQLAATSIAATPPSLPAHEVVAAERLVSHAETIPPTPSARSFQARGPPTT